MCFRCVAIPDICIHDCYVNSHNIALFINKLSFAVLNEINHSVYRCYILIFIASIISFVLKLYICTFFCMSSTESEYENRVNLSALFNHMIQFFWIAKTITGETNRINLYRSVTNLLFEVIFKESGMCIIYLPLICQLLQLHFSSFIVS